MVRLLPAAGIATDGGMAVSELLVARGAQIASLVLTSGAIVL
jgi:hypothetical protein